MQPAMNRRKMLRWLAVGLPALGALPRWSAAEASGQLRLGVDMNSYGIRWSNSAPPAARFKNILEMLDHCQQLGAGGIQARIDAWDNDFAGKVRAKLESSQMYLEGQVGLPREQAEVARFDSIVRSAKAAGASILRTVSLGGRRYEALDSADGWREFLERAWKSLVLAEPVVRKHRLRLAIENHKDWRAPELLAVLKRLGSEQVGVCVDTGNSIALLENPLAVVEAYAPHAFTSHLKDMGVQEYQDGFLLSEVPLGDGFLDLPKMIATLRRAQPQIHFNLEMITRDPLKIPCLTEKYWATMADTPAGRLAETLAMVRANAARKPLPRVTGLSPDEKLKFEEENVRKSFGYARERLAL